MKRKKRRSRYAKLLAVAVLIPLAACGLGDLGSQSSNPIDPPPAELERQMIQAAEAGLQAPTGTGEPETPAVAQPEGEPGAQTETPADSQIGAQAASGNGAPSGSGTSHPAAAEAAGQQADELTVYLMDRNGYLAPMTLSLPQNGADKRSQEEKAAAWLVEKSGQAEQLPQGFAPILPEGTVFESIKTDEETGTATVNFAQPFPKLAADRERKTVEAIVWTMTEIPGIRQVKIESGGQPLRQLPASGLPLAETLTRSYGINLERTPGIQASRSMAVTLYFSARSEEGEGYFIPVTRLVERTADKGRAALEELIKGPGDRDHLLPVVAPSVTVEELATASDRIDVSLKDAGWEPEQTVSADMMQAVVLTITESAGSRKVHISINGEESLVDSAKTSYSEPVGRPERINALTR
ncbi:MULTISPECIES: GerMN domain-containing protein [Cohnella]|uniref:GerMN domain-containing protein n=1 Tax=Cohnella TaxID=329857 RepID=UPI0009BB4289|nr:MULTISPECIES: GerMN domain-containing protein [Cohnella]MBN2984915.1 GerMN domain-containing protein [Cohnella algarum]